MEDAVAQSLQASITNLQTAITDLRVTVGILDTSVKDMTVRAGEDRSEGRSREVRIQALERWRSRISGQIAILSFVGGGVTALFLAHTFNFKVGG